VLIYQTFIARQYFTTFAQKRLKPQQKHFQIVKNLFQTSARKIYLFNKCHKEKKKECSGLKETKGGNTRYMVLERTLLWGKKTKQNKKIKTVKDFRENAEI
jgi:hypothetical protein